MKSEPQLAGGGGGGRGKRGASSPHARPVEPDKSTLWMDLFSLDSNFSLVILIIVTDICLPFSLFEVDFSETHLMTSAENSVLEPSNLKIFLGRIPPDPTTRLVPSALAIICPGYKNLATDLQV